MAAALARATSPLLLAIDAAWRFLRRPRTLAVACALLLLLLALLLVLPQMPGQVQEEPASATRWLNTETDRWGSLGPLLQSLGLFHLFSSTLFRLALTLLLLVALVQLADTIAAALGARRAGRLLTEAAPAGTDAPPGPSAPLSAPLSRRRAIVELAPAAAQATLADHLRAAGHQVRAGEWLAGAPADDDLVPATSTRDLRLLAERNRSMLWLRPLLPLGILVALTGLWLAVSLGWDVRAPSVAPGERYTFAPHDVTIDWPLPASAQQATGPLTVQAAGASVELPAAPGRTRVGDARLTLRAGPPALLVRAPYAALALPGDAAAVEQLGVVLEQPGSEQFVLLPAQGAALRLLRLPGDAPALLAELYGPDAETPLSRTTLTTTAPITLATTDATVTVTLTPAPGLDVEIRHAPWLWLLIPGLLLAAAGLLPLWKRPELLLAHVAPWPPALPTLEPGAAPSSQQAAVTLQGTSAAAVRAAAAVLGMADLNAAPAAPPLAPAEAPAP